MPTAKFLDVQCLRKRAMQVGIGSSGTVNWDPFNEGSYLDIQLSDTTTVTVAFTMPTVSGLASPSGLEIMVVVEQGPGGGGITWPGHFRFQTAGDALPNATSGYRTAWKGFVRPNDVSVHMYKLGEWP